MQFDLSLLFTALGLAFVLEGLPYFIFAERMPVVLKKLLEMSPTVLRKLGILVILTGLVLVYLGTRF